MTYIFLAAGKGVRLQPLTLNYPKTLYRLNANDTVIQRMINLIKKYDQDAEVVVVTGFLHHKIEENISGVTFINNPFYAVTNSIASLWFARDYLKRDHVTIINGDVVMADKLVKEVLCRQTEGAVVLFDSSIKKDGDYNVSIAADKVVVMSKQLDDYDGEYAGVIKLDRKVAEQFLTVLNAMVDNGQYDQWYEDALVQMIFTDNFVLNYIDICDYEWTEIDSVRDLVIAKKISRD
ncbi:MAG: NTP transferase domain-containing protein [Syntrophomonadaceae bacterium]|jgi:choline kinase